MASFASPRMPALTWRTPEPGYSRPAVGRNTAGARLCPGSSCGRRRFRALYRARRGAGGWRPPATGAPPTNRTTAGDRRTADQPDHRRRPHDRRQPHDRRRPDPVAQPTRSPRQTTRFSARTKRNNNPFDTIRHRVAGLARRSQPQPERQPRAVDPSGPSPRNLEENDVCASSSSQPNHSPGVNGVEDYDEGLDVGYRCYDATGQRPLFPFGYGLSYEQFDVSGVLAVYDPVDGTATSSLGCATRRRVRDQRRSSCTWSRPPPRRNHRSSSRATRT